MLFNSQIFLLLFLPLCLLLFYSLKTIKSREILLLIASLLFYAWWDVRFLPVLIISILFNWGIAKTLSKKTYFVTFAIVVNLLALGIFKYFNFFSEAIFTLFGIQPVTFSVVLPLGISFFTFHQISYLVDLKRQKVPEYSLLDFSFYICFFPHLIAGPIIRHNELIPQLKHILHVNHKEIAQGIILLVIGLIKKIFIADTIAPIANGLFDAAKLDLLTTPQAWLACLGFGLQIYFDFSGYSDMAVGLGKMFGFVFPNNFQAPYRATSIRDFWQRWHITLSNFLRDYLYIPLGGNRAGKVRQYCNLFITMLLAGLWHGAGWTFVIWGGLHGVALIINHLWHHLKLTMPPIVGWLLTMAFVFSSWVLFRSETFTQASNILQPLIDLNFTFAKSEWKNAWVLLPGILVISWRVTSMGVIEKIKPSRLVAAVIGLLLTFCILQSGTQSAIEFIYFQF